MLRHVSQLVDGCSFGCYFGCSKTERRVCTSPQSRFIGMNSDGSEWKFLRTISNFVEEKYRRARATKSFE